MRPQELALALARNQPGFREVEGHCALSRDYRPTIYPYHLYDPQTGAFQGD